MHLKTTLAHLGVVDSTMDAARALAADQDFLLVTATGQTRGKGTRGRIWQSPEGNLYMTVGIHRRCLPPERLALLSLEMGVLLWEEAASRLEDVARRTLGLKWPNDLQLGGRKAAGILIEGFGTYVLVGVGVNVAIAPSVEDGGTPSACLAEAGLTGDARDFAEGLFRRVVEAWSRPGDFEADAVLVAWQSKVDWDRSYRLRDRPGTPWVTPISVNRQGHLMARHGDGTVEWLVADYLA